MKFFILLASLLFSASGAMIAIASPSAVEGTEWALVKGESERALGGAALVPGAELTRTVALQPGLYELQLRGTGTGMLTLTGAGQKRTIQASSEPGVYGLLFEASQAGKIEFALTYRGSRTHRFVLTSTVLVPADAERRAAWAAAKKSYELLGYFGTDPQRRAPGLAKASAAMAGFSQAELDRCAIRETVVFHDSGYDAVWVDDDAEVAAFFTRRGLAAKDAKETETWLKARAEGDKGVGSSIVFTMGTAPANIVYQPYDDCLLAKYLRAGGRVIWMANLPMVIGQGVSGPTFSNTTEAGGAGGAPAETMLGLSRDKQIFYGVPGPTLTAAAKAWGLEPGLSLVRPFHAGGVTVPFVTDPKGDFCGVGLVSLRGDVPFSGLIFVPDQASPKNEALLRNVYRLARYSGKPVEVPQAALLPAGAVPLEASLRFGIDNQRMVYLRGENVPLLLRVHALEPGIGKVQVRYALREGEAILRKGTAELPVGTQQKDEALATLKLSDLRVGRYTLTATIDCNGKLLELSRELRIAPQPDHQGTHIAIWCSASPKMKRTEDLLDDLEAHNLDPLFADKLALGRDLALWYGFSFSTRRHGQAENVPNPPGYNNDRLGSSGRILKVRSQGDKRASKGYSSPLRRQAEANDFKPQIAFDNSFPAFRKRTVTGDDYSQWFGLDYNRYAVEGFRARFGIEPPRPKGTEDPYGTISIERAPGIIPDDDPWILLNHYWSDTLGDMGTRISRAMEAATGGTGKVGPIPGGMQLPLLNMGSGQYPPFNFGARTGFNLSSFYYYNSLWQPLLTHLWWLECARMGNRGIEQWMMPDCYQLHFESFYRNSFWLMMAGGAQGLAYFHYPERLPEPMHALKEFGAISRRYGLLLEKLRPAPKKVAMLAPFENVTYRTENGYGLAFAFMNLLLAKVDAEPVSPEELDAKNIHNYEAVVLAQTKWLKAGTVRLLEDYIAGGGKVVLDSITAEAIPIKGALALDFPFGEEGVTKYANAEAIARVRQAILPIAKPPVDCDQPFVTVRRVALPDGTPGVWVVSNHTQDEYAQLKAAMKATPDEARALEARLGYGKEIVTTTLTRVDDGRIPFDVFGGRVLDAIRADGRMTLKLEIPKWEGKLVVFLSSLPTQIKLEGVSVANPGEPVRLGIQVCDAAGTAIATPLPLRLTVRDPQGNENREYARRLVTESGSATHSFAFASNDLRGQWTLQVEDVLTGVKATRTAFLVNLFVPKTMEADPSTKTENGLSRNAAAMESYLAATESLPVLKHSDWINVKTDITPAAVGDGVADDTAALQAAFAQLDDAKTGAPRIFYFPPGTYRITDTLTLTKVQGGALYGHGGATGIVWDGPAGGRMFHSNGFGRSIWFGLSLDGAGKAAVGVDHDSKTYYETRVRYQYCRFANFTESGIRVGHDQKLASAEIMFYDLLFTNCERGISFLAFNDYDNAIVRNIFRNCGTAIDCWRGNVYLRDSQFENSGEQDLLLAPHSSSIRRCTSVGSQAFIRSSQANGEFPFLLEIQDCHVSGWKDAKGAVQLSNRGPVTVFDSVFERPEAAHSPAIILSNPDRFQQTLITANFLGEGGAPAKINPGPNSRVIQVPREREMLIVQCADRRWDHRPDLPKKIFDARTDFKAAGDARGDDSAAIQATISAAKAYGKGAEAYLPVGTYRIAKTLNLPAGNYAFGSSLGWCSVLSWAGSGDQSMVKAENADGVTVRQLRFTAPMGMDLASLRVTADRPGAFRCDGVYVGGAKNPRFRGLVLDGLPSGFRVFAPHVNGDTLVQNCGDARILIDNWYADYNAPITIVGGSGGRGFTGINSGVASCCDVDLTVRDNASIVFGDFYSEQTQAHLLATGQPGQKPGRITISAAKLEGHSPEKLKIDGYAGQISYLRANFCNTPHAFVGKSDGRCLLLLMGDAFNPLAPNFDANGISTISLGNLVWNFKDKSQQLSLPDAPLDKAAFDAVNAAMDHLRELSRANLQ